MQKTEIWFNSLNQNEQNIALFLILPKLTKHFFEELLPHNETPTKRMSLLKAYVAGLVFLEKLSTKVSETKKILNESEEVYVSFIRGEITFEELDKKNTSFAKKLLIIKKNIPENDVKNFIKQNINELEEAQNATILFAKIAGWGKLDKVE